MSRVVNTNSPGKRRNQHMRSCAELLRRVSQKQDIDDEARDMLAALWFNLRGIEDSLDEAVAAWEKRDYWIKAEHFRQKWLWVSREASELEKILHNQDWNRVPTEIVNLLPHFAEITINKFTRSSDLWNDMYQQFLEEHA